ncbi:MAG: hypothetical protein QW096_09135 [Thermofilaceae archaeon]
MLFTIFVALLRSKPTGHVLRHFKLAKILALLVKALAFMALILLALSLIIGFRPLLFFLTCGALVFNLLFLISTNELYENHIMIKLTLFTTVILFLVEPVTLTFGNDFYPRWEWWNDSIYISGSLSEYMESVQRAGLYYLVPIEEFRTISLALVTSPSYATPAIVLMTQVLSIVLSVYLLARTLYSSRFGLLISVILLLILMASPGDHVVTGRLIKTNPFIYLYLTFVASRLGLSRTLITLMIVMLAMVFYHGSVVIALLSLLTPLLVLHKVNKNCLEGADQIYRGTNAKSIAFSVTLLTLVSFTYWLFTYVANTVFGTAWGFVESLMNYFIAIWGGKTVSGWSYTPLYFTSSYYIYSYAWAFPIGVSVALAITYFIDVLTRRRSWTKIKLHEVASMAGLFYSATTYGMYTISEEGQYFIPIAFFLLHIATTIAISAILVEKRTIVRLICLTVFVGFIITGMHSPTHAMLEHPEFESAATILKATRYIEASIVSRLIPDEVTVYYDYDLPVRGGIYKTVREILHQILSGVNPVNFYAPPYTLIALKRARPTTSIDVGRLDIVYSSNFHIILGVRR